MLTISPILAYLDFTKPFILHTDASKNALGAVLSQKDDNGMERVICYTSRTTNWHEQNYDSTQLECLAVYWAIKHFKEYLFGHFIVITDHKAFSYIFNNKDIYVQYSRWIMNLTGFDFNIIHRAGKKHLNANTLLRLRIEYK